MKVHQFPGPSNQPGTLSNISPLQRLCCPENRSNLPFSTTLSVRRVNRDRAVQMEASTASAMATRSPAHPSMNPTTTEHDFRFPRRPLDAPSSHRDERDGGSNTNNKTSPGDLRADLQELKIDLSGSYPRKGDDMRWAVFPLFQDDISLKNDSSTQSPEELQKQDPLAAQIWRFYSKTKQMLPNQDRMQNLTWRMMHLNLRKQQQRSKQQEQQAAR